MQHAFLRKNRGQLAVGQRLFIDGKVAVIKVYDDRKEALFFDEYGGRLRFYKPGFLRGLLLEGRITLISRNEDISSWNRLTEEQQATIKRREAYCTALLQSDRPHVTYVRDSVIAAVAREIEDPQRPGGSTVSRWFKQWITDGYIMDRQVVKDKSCPFRVDDQITGPMPGSVSESQSNSSLHQTISRKRFQIH